MANKTHCAEFLLENLEIQNNVIMQSFQHNVKKFCFLGSSCIYPRQAPQPIKEEYLLTGPLETTNEGYALAKISGYKLCLYLSRQYGWNTVSLMPCNLYGTNDTYDLVNGHVFPAFVRRFVEAARENRPEEVLWGTGKPLREFLHVDDVANAVYYFMQNHNEPEIINVGYGTDITIRELAEKIAAAVAMLREKNPTATIVTTAWDALTGEQILKAMSTKDDFKAELIAMAAKANAEHAHEDEEEEHEHHHHHDHDDDHDEHCCCGHHHDDDDDEDEHEHHHHHDHDDDHDEHCCCGHHHDHDDDDEDEHEHHHHHDHDDHDEHCCCGHHHHHHHDHDADEVFTSWGVETAKKFSKADIEHALTELDTGNYGMILRSKGIVDGGADGWLEFDYVPGEWEVRARGADVGGKLVVIGSKLDEKAIAALFGC